MLPGVDSSLRPDESPLPLLRARQELRIGAPDRRVLEDVSQPQLERGARGWGYAGGVAAWTLASSSCAGCTPASISALVVVMSAALLVAEACFHLLLAM